MVRLKDIAEMLGCSVMTVSKALRDEPDVSAATRTKVKLAAQQMGYVPDSSARGLRTRTTKLLGLAVSSCADPILSGVASAIEQLAYEMGYDILLAQNASLPEREEACLRRFLARRVDGIFIVPVPRLTGEAAVFQELLSRRVPSVLLGPAPAYCSGFASVAAEEEPASCAVTRHLLQLGHRRIAFLSGPQGCAASQARYQGYRRALAEVGLDFQEEWVFNAGLTAEDGGKAAKQFLGEQCRATAIQAVNDPVAIGCMKHLAASGLGVPQDISITGFGDIYLSDSLLAPLTTVRLPKQRLGQAAIQAMQRLLKNKPPEQKILPAELVVRASTGIAPA